MWILYLLGLYVLLLIFVHFSNLSEANAKAKAGALLLKEKLAAKIAELEKNVDKIVAEKSMGFPWVAEVLSQYIEQVDLDIAKRLEHKRPRAPVEAKRIREIAKEKKLLKKELVITHNFVKYYESLFPWLTEYVGENLDDLIKQVTTNEKKIDDEIDPVQAYMPQAEYNALSTIDRNQKALDRYLASRKESWQIGRDYERYIGYLYENDGYDVVYQGIELGLEDLGRDLICTKHHLIEIVQCKCWSRNKTIHEKHINQLFGTTVQYFITTETRNKNLSLSLFTETLKNGNLRATFVTSTSLSETAKDFALALGINVKQQFPLTSYPVIKCNINPSTHEKIYHLPFDQQYDRTKIIKTKGELYASSVAEAERLGFRRAWRWRGDKTQN